MTVTAPIPDAFRLEAARIAFALLRFQEPMAHPVPANSGKPVLGRDTYLFTPSWRPTPRNEVEGFLATLPSPALLSPTVDRGVIALTLVQELSGERRKWAEKTISNHGVGLDELGPQLGLSPQSRILLEFDAESHVFTYAGVRCWTEQFAVQVGWNLGPLTGDPRADAQLCVRRSDGTWSPPMHRPSTSSPA